MHRLRVGGGTQEITACGEDQRCDPYTTFDAASELLNPLAILHTEHTYHSAALRGCGQQSAAGRETQRRKGRVMCLDCHARTQFIRIEDSQLAAGLTDGKRQMRVQRERTETQLIGRYILDRVQDLHVAYIMYVYALGQTNDQSLSIHAHRQYLRRIEAIADVLFLLEMQHLQAVGFLCGDQHHKGTIEETLHYPYLLGVVLGENLLDLVLAGNRVKTQARAVEHREGAEAGRIYID